MEHAPQGEWAEALEHSRCWKTPQLPVVGNC